MSIRLPYYDLSAEALSGLRDDGTYLEKSLIGRELLELVYLRVSQINGCAFCLKKHSKVLREYGVSQEKLDVVAGWHASTSFSDKERSALSWAESLLLLLVQHTRPMRCLIHFMSIFQIKKYLTLRLPSQI